MPAQVLALAHVAQEVDELLAGMGLRPEARPEVDPPVVLAQHRLVGGPVAGVERAFDARVHVRDGRAILRGAGRFLGLAVCGARLVLLLGREGVRPGHPAVVGQGVDVEELDLERGAGCRPTPPRQGDLNPFALGDAADDLPAQVALPGRGGEAVDEPAVVERVGAQQRTVVVQREVRMVERSRTASSHGR